MEHTTHTERGMAMSEELDRIEARAAKYRVRSALPQVEDLQDDRDYLLTLARKQAAALERVRVIENRLERSMQGEDREIAEDLRSALGDGDE